VRTSIEELTPATRGSRFTTQVPCLAAAIAEYSDCLRWSAAKAGRDSNWKATRIPFAIGKPDYWMRGKWHPRGTSSALTVIFMGNKLLTEPPR